MVRPRLYGRCDIHNRELRRRRIAHCRLLSFTESLALGNAGLSIFSLKNFPANFSAQALIREQKPSVRYRPHSTFPVKPSETPVFRTSPSKGQSLNQPIKRPQIAPFQLSAHFGHLHHDRHSRSNSAQNTPFFNIFLTAFWQTLGISETNSPILQD